MGQNIALVGNLKLILSEGACRQNGEASYHGCSTITCEQVCGYNAEANKQVPYVCAQCLSLPP